MASTGTTLLYDTFRNRVQIPSTTWSVINATPQFGFGLWTPYSGAIGLTTWGISTLGTTTSYMYGVTISNNSAIPIGILPTIGKITNYDLEWSGNGVWGGSPATNYPDVFLRLPAGSFTSSTPLSSRIRFSINLGNLQVQEQDSSGNYDSQTIGSLSIPINPIYNGIYTAPHNFKLSLKGRQIDVYLGLNGATATYRGTFYSVANLNNPINFMFTNFMNNIASITFPYTAVSNVKVTSNSDIDYSSIFYDSFNRSATTGITVGSPSFGGPYSSVGTNAGISIISSTARLYSSNDVSGFSSSIFKDIFPNTNNFRFEFDEVFAPVAGTTGRAFIPYFRYNTADSSYLWLDLRSTGVSLNWTTGGVTTTIASGATSHVAGTVYRYAVQVKGDQIDVISQSTTTTTGVTIISQTGVTFNNAAAQNQVGFNYFKGTAEASAYNTYLNNFIIFDLGAQSAVLGEFQGQTDSQSKVSSKVLTGRDFVYPYDTRINNDTSFTTNQAASIGWSVNPIESSGNLPGYFGSNITTTSFRGAFMLNSTPTIESLGSNFFINSINSLKFTNKASGGISSKLFPVDYNKSYRYVLYFRYLSGTPDGSLYLGAGAPSQEISSSTRQNFSSGYTTFTGSAGGFTLTVNSASLAAISGLTYITALTNELSSAGIIFQGKTQVSGVTVNGNTVSFSVYTGITLTGAFTSTASPSVPDTFGVTYPYKWLYLNNFQSGDRIYVYGGASGIADGSYFIQPVTSGQSGTTLVRLSTGAALGSGGVTVTASGVSTFTSGLTTSALFAALNNATMAVSWINSVSYTTGTTTFTLSNGVLGTTTTTYSILNMVPGNPIVSGLTTQGLLLSYFTGNLSNNNVERLILNIDNTNNQIFITPGISYGDLSSIASASSGHIPNQSWFIGQYLNAFFSKEAPTLYNSNIVLQNNVVNRIQSNPYIFSIPLTGSGLTITQNPGQWYAVIGYVFGYGITIYPSNPNGVYKVSDKTNIGLSGSFFNLGYGTTYQSIRFFINGTNLKTFEWASPIVEELDPAIATDSAALAITERKYFGDPVLKNISKVAADETTTTDNQFKGFSQIEIDGITTTDIPPIKGITKPQSDGIGITDNQFKLLTKDRVLDYVTASDAPFSLAFNGTSDYVQANNLITAYPFTLECWVKFNSVGTDQRFFYISDSAGSARYWGLRINTSRVPILNVRNTIDNNIVPTGVTVGSGIWYHFAGVFDTNSKNLYLNGVKIAGSTDGTTFNNAATNRILMGLYRTNSPGSYLNGNMSDIRVWNYARSDAEIANNYKRKLVGNETGLIGYWKAEDNRGISLLDSTTNANNGTFNGTSWLRDNPYQISAFPFFYKVGKIPLDGVTTTDIISRKDIVKSQQDGITTTDTTIKNITKPSIADGITTTDNQFKSLTKTPIDGITTTDIEVSKLLARSLSDSTTTTDVQIVKRFALISSDQIIILSGIGRGKSLSDSISPVDGPYEKYSNYAVGYVFGSIPIAIQQQIILKLQSNLTINQILEINQNIIGKKNNR